MKARVPKNFSGNSAPTNMPQIAKQAQKMQEEMTKATEELEQKSYTSTSGGGAVTAVLNGKLELTSLEIKPEVIDPDDADILSDLVIAAVNECIRKATEEKNTVMEDISGGISIPGLF